MSNNSVCPLTLREKANSPWEQQNKELDKYQKEIKKYKNKAFCKKCNSIIESVHRHDFVSCSCGSIFVDGGNEYWRSGGDPSNFERIYEEK